MIRPRCVCAVECMLWCMWTLTCLVARGNNVVGRSRGSLLRSVHLLQSMADGRRWREKDALWTHMCGACGMTSLRCAGLYFDIFQCVRWLQYSSRCFQDSSYSTAFCFLQLSSLTCMMHLPPLSEWKRSHTVVKQKKCTDIVGTSAKNDEEKPNIQLNQKKTLPKSIIHTEKRHTTQQNFGSTLHTRLASTLRLLAAAGFHLNIEFFFEILLLCVCA